MKKFSISNFRKEDCMSELAVIEILSSKVNRTTNYEYADTMSISDTIMIDRLDGIYPCEIGTKT
jgi:hypothetical protein